MNLFIPCTQAAKMFSCSKITAKCVEQIRDKLCAGLKVLVQMRIITSPVRSFPEKRGKLEENSSVRKSFYS